MPASNLHSPCSHLMQHTQQREADADLWPCRTCSSLYSENNSSLTVNQELKFSIKLPCGHLDESKRLSKTDNSNWNNSNLSKWVFRGKFYVKPCCPSYMFNWIWNLMEVFTLLEETQQNAHKETYKRYEVNVVSMFMVVWDSFSWSSSF